MSSALVVYGSTYGQTERVAERIAGALRDAGFVVDIHRGDRLPTPLSVAAYDGVVVAASVLMLPAIHPRVRATAGGPTQPLEVGVRLGVRCPGE